MNGGLVDRRLFIFTLLDNLMHKPKTNDAQTWASYWQAQSQPWRKEPEIDPERQSFLEKQRAIPPDVARGQYPFKDIKLGRADIEWLLATHEQGRGPVDWHTERERTGPDLRGADLRLADLQKLPLARMLGGLPWSEWLPATMEQRTMALVHLEGAQMNGTHLEGAALNGAYLTGALLYEANLERAELGGAHLSRTVLARAQMQDADLIGAHLEDAYLNGVHLEDAYLSGAHMQDADFSRAYLEGASFYKAHLEGARLHRAHLEMTNLIAAHCEGADLSNTRLEEADMELVHFGSKIVAPEDLARIRKWVANFPEHLPAATLKGTSLERSD